jgi:hypothetical protein
MKSILLLFFSLLAQTLFAQKTAVQQGEKFDSAFVFTIIKGKTDTVEAIFKWVADNISYDVKRIEFQYLSTQSVAETFETKTGICGDYTDLLNAFLYKAGYKVQKVVGYTIDNYGKADTLQGHAWTAVKDKGEWYLLDATWAAGGVEEWKKTFRKQYKAKYYKTPPSEMLKNHIPHDPIWRLTDTKHNIDKLLVEDILSEGKSELLRLERCDSIQTQNPLQQKYRSDFIIERININRSLAFTYYNNFVAWYNRQGEGKKSSMTDKELMDLQNKVNKYWHNVVFYSEKLPNKITDLDTDSLRTNILQDQKYIDNMNIYFPKFFKTWKIFRVFVSLSSSTP